ncbi:MAG TPA: STAS domain-containing protein [Kiritimatiellia bacterium]|nr:STAS domain-containing protein [Kiritimatiellia bacterium]
MRECQIKQEVVGSVDILRLDGALDAYSFPRLEHAFNQLRDKQRNQIVLDCSNLDYINSASLGALIGFARKVREQGGDLKLAALTPKIYSIVELLGFDKMLQIFPDAQLAVSKF